MSVRQAELRSQTIYQAVSNHILTILVVHVCRRVLCLELQALHLRRQLLLRTDARSLIFTFCWVSAEVLPRQRSCRHSFTGTLGTFIRWVRHQTQDISPKGARRAGFQKEKPHLPPRQRTGELERSSVSSSVHCGAGSFSQPQNSALPSS